MKDQCFLPSYIYNDNANIYMFIKTLNEKKNIVYTFFIKQAPLYAGLGSKQNV